MTKAASVGASVFAAFLAVSSAARADFSGQPILGPMEPDDVVVGDTTGASDDNDGWFSGTHIFDLWTGPDDVWAVNWPGGIMIIDMIYNPAVGDLDLFLYEPGDLDGSTLDSLVNTGLEHIDRGYAPAGTYYLLVDGFGGDSGAYTLGISPEPGTMALLGLGLAAAMRRARKAS